MNQPAGYLGYSGFNPNNQQDAYGTPRLSPYGAELRQTPPMMTVDWYPTYPYRGEFNYHGWQFYADPVTEAILARTMGYGGIAPLALQPLANTPEPWEGLY